MSAQPSLITSDDPATFAARGVALPYRLAALVTAVATAPGVEIDDRTPPLPATVAAWFELPHGAAARANAGCRSGTPPRCTGTGLDRVARNQPLRGRAA